MPEIAANTTEAILTTWAVPEGGAFAAGDTLVAVETEKANVDVPAETAGVLLRRLADEGTRLEVGSPIALLGAVGEVVEDVDRALFELGLVGATAVGRSSTGTPGCSGRMGIAPAGRAGCVQGRRRGAARRAPVREPGGTQAGPRRGRRSR